VKAQVALYLAEIKRRMLPYEFAVFVQEGARYQTNANVGPNSSVVLALGQSALLGNQFVHAPDWNFFNLATTYFSYKLDKRGDAIELILLGYYAQQDQFRQFDLGLLEAIVGPRIFLNQSVSIKPYAIGDLVWLGDAPYFDAYGGGGSIRSPVGEHLLLEAYVENRYRHFYDSTNFPTSSQQTGNLTTAAIATELRYGFLHFTTRLGYDRSSTAFAYTSYDRWSVDVGAPIEFVVPINGVGHQIVFTPTAGYSYAPYKGPDPLIDPLTTRVDRETRVGGIIDLQIYQNIGLRTQITQSWVHSTLPNFTMKNFAVAFGPTARF
jgi:hypothetical protein